MMNKHAVIVSALALAVGVAGCQQDNKDLKNDMEQMAKDMREMKADMAKLAQAAASGQFAGAGAAGAKPPARQKRPEPDPKDVYAVPVDGNPSDGPADALITIVKGYEYACPFCEKVRPTLEQLHKDYGDKLRVVYKQYVVHPQTATAPALAVCAAHQQKKFKELDKLMWEKAYAVRKFDDAHMEALAKEAGLDVAKFKADVAGVCKDIIKKDQAELQAVGQGATPTFYINGRYMSGAQPLPAFKAVIDEELKKAQERVSSGTSPRDYYKTWVIEKGLKRFVPKQDPAAGGAPAPGGKPAIQIKPGGAAPAEKPAN